MEYKTYVIVRPDLFAIHTMQITKKKAMWLFDKAYFKVMSIELRERYLKAWGKVIYLRYLSPHTMKLIGIYENEDQFLTKARETVDDAVYDILRNFIHSPIIPERYVRVRHRDDEKAKRVESFTLDYSYLDFYEVLHEKVPVVLPRTSTFKYIAEYDNYEDEYSYYGISVYKKAVWLWMQEAGRRGTLVISFSKNVTTDDVIAFANDANYVLERVREKVSAIERLVHSVEDDLAKMGLANVVDAIKTLVVYANVAS